MPRRLPPFPALFAFEAAARHLSFRLAAEELCVSRSAASRRVRSLEDFFGPFRAWMRGEAELGVPARAAAGE